MLPNDDFAVFRAHCDKCQRWYNPASPHICFPGDTDLVGERRKLLKFIGDDWTLIGKEEHGG